ncbi:hypothetical protein ACFFRR_004805 [Megaselia abdita]
MVNGYKAAIDNLTRTTTSNPQEATPVVTPISTPSTKNEEGNSTANAGNIYIITGSITLVGLVLVVVFLLWWFLRKRTYTVKDPGTIEGSNDLESDLHLMEKTCNNNSEVEEYLFISTAFNTTDQNHTLLIQNLEKKTGRSKITEEAKYSVESKVVSVIYKPTRN